SGRRCAPESSGRGDGEQPAVNWKVRHVDPGGLAECALRVTTLKGLQEECEVKPARMPCVERDGSGDEPGTPCRITGERAQEPDRSHRPAATRVEIDRAVGRGTKRGGVALE